jgi:predicted AlkP superfamily pyrophosphatase or phosphodiesterase
VRNLLTMLVLFLATGPSLIFLTSGPSGGVSQAAPAPPHHVAATGGLPRLVLQITVDQLRGDLPLRLQDRFSPGGFLYLLDHGTWYTAAHHAHAYTETIVGHTTLATGAYPSRHGMIANNWFDRQTKQNVKNIESTKFHLVGAPASTGASPDLILTSTFSDELAVATAGRAKIFAVSRKDRGAVPLAGHAGKAFWFSNSTGCFVSSVFYYEAYPAWVNDWCTRAPAKAYENKDWILLGERKDYLFRDNMNQYDNGTTAEANMKMLDSEAGGMFGRTFPHHILPGKTFYDVLTITPFADDLTLDFAEKLIDNEGLGTHEAPDYLAISFSSTDVAGHWFSPSSLESEDTLLRLDQTLAALFTYVDEKVGLANTLIVLAGDHGGPEYPEVLEKMHINTGRVTKKDIGKAADDALAARFGTNAKGIILSYSHPYIYLDHAVITTNKQNQAEIEDLIAEAVTNVRGVELAIPTRRLATAVGPDAELLLQIAHNQNAARSGEIYIVPKSQWQVEGSRTILLEHGSPWPYDTYVPIAFGGAGVPAATISRAVSTVDVAATLAVALRTRFPSGCAGKPLTEVLDRKALPVN